MLTIESPVAQWLAYPYQITEDGGFESHLGLGFFRVPSGFICNTLYLIPVLICNKIKLFFRVGIGTRNPWQALIAGSANFKAISFIIYSASSGNPAVENYMFTVSKDHDHYFLYYSVMLPSKNVQCSVKPFIKELVVIFVKKTVTYTTVLQNHTFTY